MVIYTVRKLYTGSCESRIQVAVSCESIQVAVRVERVFGALKNEDLKFNILSK